MYGQDGPNGENNRVLRTVYFQSQRENGWFYFELYLKLRECDIQYYFYDPANHEETDQLEWPDLTQEGFILESR